VRAHNGPPEKLKNDQHGGMVASHKMLHVSRIVETLADMISASGLARIQCCDKLRHVSE
jgi:hypothetical protein